MMRKNGSILRKNRQYRFGGVWYNKKGILNTQEPLLTT